MPTPPLRIADYPSEGEAWSEAVFISNQQQKEAFYKRKAVLNSEGGRNWELEPRFMSKDELAQRDAHFSNLAERKLAERDRMTEWEQRKWKMLPRSDDEESWGKMLTIVLIGAWLLFGLLYPATDQSTGNENCYGSGPTRYCD